MRNAAKALAVLVLVGPAAQAQDVPPEPPPPVEAPAAEAPPARLQLDAFVSTSFHWNFADPPSRTNALRVFDTTEGDFSIDVFELVAQKVAPQPGDVGFRADLTGGAAIPEVVAARGLFRDPDTGEADHVDLQQAFVAWHVPVGSGLRLDAGKFVSPIGYEVIEGYDGWNDHATRAFLFYMQPWTHTGLRAAYDVSDDVTLTGYVVNGWDNVLDNNEGKTFGVQGAWKASETLQLYATAMAGPERDEEDAARRLVDVVGVWDVTNRLRFAANVDFGWESDVPGIGDASWNGVVAYGRWLIGDNGALSLRAERFSDDDGFRTGVEQTITTLTFTPEWRLSERSAFRFDLRRDSSDADVFEDGNGLPSDSQTTLSFNLLVAF